MTNDRKHPHNSDVGDPEVSASYREIAREQTPEALNAAVLRQAAASVAGAKSTSVRWLRPMAWAATIGLSLALVLELSNVPVVPQDDFAAIRAPEMPASMPARRRDEGRISLDNATGLVSADLAEAEAEAPVAEVVEEAPVAEAPVEVAATPAAASEVLKKELAPINSAPAGAIGTLAASGAAVADDARDEIDAEGLQLRDRDSDSSARSAPLAATAVAAFQVDSPAITEEAKSRYAIGEKRSGAYADEPVADELVAEEPCDDNARAEAASWLECILELEEAGDAETALEQRELLREAFPDFKKD